MRTIVVGAGPAGVMSAIKAAEASDVVLFDSNSKIGRKLYITGKGRCNFTNIKEDFISKVVVNPKFFYSSLRVLSQRDLINFFETKGVRTKVERGGRVFPFSDKSSDIVDCLYKDLINKKVLFQFNQSIVKINVNDKRVISVVTDTGKIWSCDYLVLATGGLSHPQTGSIGLGYQLAKSLGHTIISPVPSLVSIKTTQEDNCCLPEGLTLKNVELTIKNNVSNKVIYNAFGEILFTKTGLSGPLILSASAYINRLNFAELILSIDLKPALTQKELDDRVLSELDNHSNKNIVSLTKLLMPRSLVNLFLFKCGIDGDIKANALTKNQRKIFVTQLKNLFFNIHELDGFERAVVTSGGIKTKEINPSTMQSKIIENLYFAGEIIDIDALTGGYNLQIAFSTGYVAGKSICDKINIQNEYKRSKTEHD